MKFDEMVELQRKTKVIRKKPRELEHKIQCQMVKWFRLQYPEMKHNLFSVPNGGLRDEVTAAKMKAEGQLAGVSDLILLKSNRFHGALLVETKTKEGRQSDNQKDWQQKITNDGYKYVIVRSLDDFIREVKLYLSQVD